MNQGTVTGGIVGSAAGAVSASTRERIVTFTVAVRDRLGVESFWPCEARGDPELLAFLEGQAFAGRGIKLEYELTSRPFNQQGVHKGDVRYLRVLRAEVAPRKSESLQPAESEG